MNYYQYCEQKVAPKGSTEYYSLYSLDNDKRQASVAIKAFHQAISNIHYQCTDMAIAETKFVWWQQEIESLFESKAQHPISHALLSTIENYALDKTLFLDLIAGIKTNASYNAYHKAVDLIQHCHRASHAYTTLLLTVFGYEDKKTTQFSHDLGIGLALLDQIRFLRRDLQKGLCYFPTEDLEKFELDINTLLTQAETTDLTPLLTLQSERVNTFFDQALQHLPTTEYYRQRSFLILLNLRKKLLHELQQSAFPVLEQQTQLTPLRKFWCCWQTVRHAKKKSLAYNQLTP